jgi:hypothetical protein
VLRILTVTKTIIHFFLLARTVRSTRNRWHGADTRARPFAAEQAIGRAAHATAAVPDVQSAMTGSPRTARRSVIATLAVVIAASAPMSGRTADLPTLLVLPLEMVDTSGETPSRASEHQDRLAALTHYLADELAARGLYATADAAPIGAAIDKARAGQPLDRCNGCERELARMVSADRVLIGELDKVSTLIGSLHLIIMDVPTGRAVVDRTLGFRGDTDDAWRHAVRFFVRDLAAIDTLHR